MQVRLRLELCLRPWWALVGLATVHLDLIVPSMLEAASGVAVWGRWHAIGP